METDDQKENKNMNKTIVLAGLLSIVLSTTAQNNDRYVDSKIEFFTPDQGSVIQSPINLVVGFLLTNQGPDSLYPDDSITWEFTHLFEESDLPRRRKPIGEFIPPGGSRIYYDTMLINGDKDLEKFPVWFWRAPSCFGLQEEGRQLKSEWFDDVRKDNNPRLNLVHRKFSSVGSLQPDSSMSIYPNPSQGILHLEMEDIQDIKAIDLMDILGKTETIRCINERDQTITLDLSAYAKGVYFIRVRREGVGFKSKLILY
jgi:hypothetical protein